MVFDKIEIKDDTNFDSIFNETGSYSKDYLRSSIVRVKDTNKVHSDQSISNFNNNDITKIYSLLEDLESKKRSLLPHSLMDQLEDSIRMINEAKRSYILGDYYSTIVTSSVAIETFLRFSLIIKIVADNKATKHNLKGLDKLLHSISHEYTEAYPDDDSPVYVTSDRILERYGFDTAGIKKEFDGSEKELNAFLEKADRIRGDFYSRDFEKAKTGMHLAMADLLRDRTMAKNENFLDALDNSHSVSRVLIITCNEKARRYSNRYEILEINRHGINTYKKEDLDSADLPYALRGIRGIDEVYQDLIERGRHVPSG